MDYKDLLVHLDGTEAGKARTEAAVALAAAWDAHLTGLCLMAEPVIPPMLGIAIGADVLERQRAEATAEGEAILARFREAGTAAGIAVEARFEMAPIDTLPRRFARHARHVDLSIVGQPPPSDGVDETMLVEAAFLETGRPALVVPYIGARDMPPRRILVAWDGGREAARAIGDALPFLCRADDVSLVVVDPAALGDRIGEEPGADMARHLARHGVKVTVRAVATGGLAVGDVLLGETADWAADLLVMGGFGHSRLRELVLGGVTRHLIEHMTVPVLLAH
jgi:nucleotide-binding universal stress UspA family protein